MAISKAVLRGWAFAAGVAASVVGLVGCGGGLGASSPPPRAEETRAGAVESPDPGRSDSSGDPAPSESAANRVGPGIPVNFDITDPDGYTYTISGAVPDSVPVVIDTANSKPGEATIIAGDGLSFTLTARNTTPGRNAPGFWTDAGASGLPLLPVYAADSAACTELPEHSSLDYQKESGGKLSDTYCVLFPQLAAREMSGDGSQDSMPPGEAISVTYAFSSGYPGQPGHGNFVVDESIAPQVAESVSRPAGWVAVGNGFSSSTEQDRKVCYGLTGLVSDLCNAIDVLWGSVEL